MFAIFGASENPAVLARLRRLEKKIDLILQNLGIEVDQEMLSSLSDAVRDLADDPSKKIQAIKQYRLETGASLKAAKDAVEAYIAGKG
jgi:ribosomal protein L7/L12